MRKKKGAAAKSNLPEVSEILSPLSKLPSWAFPAISAGVTLLVFASSLRNGFINLDDNAYIYDNPLVTAPFSISNLVEIFTSFAVGNYHPLTILFLHIINIFFGTSPGAFHFFSLVFHLGNTLFLFYFFQRLTGKPLVALLVALLFGIHPLHVEPVAWASSFKDVLYVFFYLCAMFTYLIHVQQKRKNYLWYTGIFFLLSLLSKGMAVTLPVTLLLIEMYVEKQREWNWETFSKKVFSREKLPFFLLAVLFGIIAFMAQQGSGAVNTESAGVNYSAFEKWISIPSYALCGYISKLLLPINLSAFYAYPPKVSAVYPLIVLVLAVLIVWRFRTNKTVMFGILFFFLNIILVVQILPVGGAVMADRYSYLSLVGLFVIVAIFIEEKFRQSNTNTKKIIAVAIGVYLLTLLGMSYARTKVWRESKKLWYSALNENPNNYFVHGGMGELFLAEGNADSALFHLHTALYIFPYNRPVLHSSMASAYLLSNQLDSAISHSTEALKYNSSLTKAYEARGEAYIRKQMPKEALGDFHQAMKLTPSDLPGMCLNMGVAYGQTGKVDSAILFFTQAINVSSVADSVSSIALLNRSLSYSIKGDLRKALEDAYTAKSKGRILNEQYIPELESRLNSNK